MKIYCFDIDGTVCTNTNGNYKLAEPYSDRISEINKLRDEGNKIIFFTARGSGTGIDWVEFTKNQLDTWGLSYDEILFGKPEADYFIDDKSIDLFNWFE
tara:strand:+ start:12342 stop:12638 length:297 start_codon:yes stop_codon:yes gene_type:complete